ncbi:hypothetical protein CspeluHIS016_0200370 [Cutaneotrichosporon spelunceum]|uniref:DNA damage-binding protein 1 n=1 Tax=Cutaneotrichosporon spelunceum TaxID=1672016 RepID=A0AAD3Y9J6_9TREE|nr:hypothetical protein CspeluHIS016_0200370 [Cutaneotrichosporon spelunceum]
MLYIASALTPTPVSHTVLASDFTASGTQSLLIAKPDRIEVWDVGSNGLTPRGDLMTWGTVAGLATVDLPGAKLHVLVVVGPPCARLLLIAWENGLVTTASHPLRPPTPALRRQEFFAGAVAQGSTALVSMWTGLLACAEMEMEKAADAKRRVADDKVKEARRIVFKTVYNINIREHNLLGFTFLSRPEGAETTLMFLWMNEQNKIQLGARVLVKQRILERGSAVDVVNPAHTEIEPNDDPDFNEIPFSCPAARNILAVSERHVLIVGDEHAVLYNVSEAKAKRASAKRSPQAETGGVGKRRKSSVTGRGVSTDNDTNIAIQPVWRVRQGWGTVLATTVLETHGRGASVVLGDERGRLTALGWEFDGTYDVRVGRVDLGIASPPTALTYIDNGVMFVSSACGDSLLVSFSLPEKGQAQSAGTTAPRNIKGKGRAQDSIDNGTWTVTVDDEATADQIVMERWMNLAPLKDLAVIEEEDGRLSHLVVASGSANTNSLRVVRSGVGLETVISIEGVVGVERIWAFDWEADNPSSQDAMLVVSFAALTAIFNVGAETTQVEVPADLAAEPTLACQTNNGGLVQVTPSGIRTWAIEGPSFSPDTKQYAPVEEEVVAATFANNCILIALRNGILQLYRSGPRGLERIKEGKPGREVSAIALHLELGDNAPSNTGDVNLGSEGLNAGAIVATAYFDGTITVFHSDEMQKDKLPVLAKTRERAHAISLRFYTDENGVLRLMAGLADGTLVNYDADEVGLKSNLTKGRMQSSLGSLPLTIANLKIKSERFEERVIAAGISDRLSVVFESRGHLEFSASGKKNVVDATTLSAPGLGDVLVLATHEGITLERFTSLKKLQVLTRDTCDSSATRLAYVPQQDILAVGSVTRSLDAETGEIFQSSSLDLHHPATLEFLTDYQLPEREAVASVTAVFLNGRHYIALGTAIFSSADALDEANIEEVNSFISVEKGRLILMEATETGGKWSLDFIQTLDTTGAVFDASVIHGFLVIASANKVSILRLTDGKLQETASFTFAFEAHYLSVLRQGNTDLLVLGDAMRSIIVLDIDAESGEIRADHRDMAPHAVRALGTVKDGSTDVILTDGNANLLTYRVGESLTPAASFGLHEDVARFRTGALAATHPDELQADLLFATADGRLGMVGELGTSATRTLSDLQRNMAKYKRGPGNVEWRESRRGGSALVPKETAGFIDGDFVQTFLDDADERYIHGATEHERVARIVDGVKKPASAKHVRRVLEACAGMH